MVRRFLLCHIVKNTANIEHPEEVSQSPNFSWMSFINVPSRFVCSQMNGQVSPSIWLVQTLQRFYNIG